MKKNAGVFNLLLTAAIFLLLSGCRKSLVENQTDPLLGTGKQAKTLTTLGVPPDVYVAGSEGGQAKYWKNGLGVVLSGGEQANGIVAIGTDVYVSGWGHDPTTHNFVAKYWKNGVLTNLSDGTDNVLTNGIAVLGTDVYIAGTAGAWVRNAVYWKNGVITSLGSGQCDGIFVAPNGDIYIPNGAYGGATYWKNGTLVTLSTTATQYINAITVQGSDVYAVGVNDIGNHQTALYWKNGSLGFLTTSSNFTDAMAIAVSATGRVFISGTTGPAIGNLQIGYWTPLGDLNIISSGEFVALTTGIAIDGDENVYICGSEFNSVSTPPARAKYWVNGQVVNLSSGTTDATALAITLGQ